jgi:hypothetical protein
MQKEQGLVFSGIKETYFWMEKAKKINNSNAED